MLAEFTHLEIKEMLATRNSIDELLQRIYREQYVDAAKNELRRMAPQNSADRVLSYGQKITLVAILALVAVGFVLSPRATAVGLVSFASAFYLASSLYKARLIYRSLGSGAYIEVSDEEIAAIDERDLPIYTILVPLYKEAAVVPRLLAGIGGLDYPQTKLDVRLLCEEDDEETIDAIRTAGPAAALPPRDRPRVAAEDEAEGV